MFWLRDSTAFGLNAPPPESGSSMGAGAEFNKGSIIGALLVLDPPLRGSAKPLSGSESGFIVTELDLVNLDAIVGVGLLLLGGVALDTTTSFGRLGKSG